MLTPIGYSQEMARLQRTIEDFNSRIYAPAGLYIRWPRDVGFLFVCGPALLQPTSHDAHAERTARDRVLLGQLAVRLDAQCSVRSRDAQHRRS